MSYYKNVMYICIAAGSASSDESGEEGEFRKEKKKRTRTESERVALKVLNFFKKI